jgi:DNA-3-methyladenine glycosylase
MRQRLPRSFFQDYTPRVAERLLGNHLVRRLHGKILSGMIVEVEAYRGREDPASHAYRGPTPRNRLMFEEAGRAYVYFTYGFHHCLNVTTEKTGVPGAVLIRALQPLTGIEMMKENRKIDELGELTNGPGKLTKALGIDRELNGEDMVESSRLFIVKGEPQKFRIKSSSRVGIDMGLEFKWRYLIEGNLFVSRAHPAA